MKTLVTMCASLKLFSEFMVVIVKGIVNGCNTLKSHLNLLTQIMMQNKSEKKEFIFHFLDLCLIGGTACLFVSCFCLNGLKVTNF